MATAQPAGAEKVAGEDSMAASSLIRWSGLAAVLGGVLFIAVDGATTGASAVQQTLLLLGTMLLLGGWSFSSPPSPAQDFSWG
jgi:hypothetical protein